MDLKVLLKILREGGVKRAVFDKETDKPIDIELFEVSVPVNNFNDLIDSDLGEKKCPCGHLEDTQHNAAGCLEGCDLTDCIARKDKTAI